MKPDYEAILARTATIDELLSETAPASPEQVRDADLAERRYAAWCQAAAGSDTALFARRLGRDGLSRTDVLARLASACAGSPAWTKDAGWVSAALEGAEGHDGEPGSTVPFGHLLAPLVDAAAARLLDGLTPAERDCLTESSVRDLRGALTTDLSELSAPAIYDLFTEARDGGDGYREFVAKHEGRGLPMSFRGETRPTAADEFAHPAMDRLGT